MSFCPPFSAIQSYTADPPVCRPREHDLLLQYHDGHRLQEKRQMCLGCVVVHVKQGSLMLICWGLIELKEVKICWKMLIFICFQYLDLIIKAIDPRWNRFIPLQTYKLVTNRLTVQLNGQPIFHIHAAGLSNLPYCWGIFLRTKITEKEK